MTPRWSEKCLDILIEEDVCDIIVIYMAMATQSPALTEIFMEIFRNIRAKHPEVPIVAGIYAEGECRRELEDLGYIVSREPTRAVGIAASLLNFGRSFAADMLPATLPGNGVIIPSETLNEVAAKKLLAAAGIPVVVETLVKSGAEAAAAVAALGQPAAMKLVSPDILHKSGNRDVEGRTEDAAAAYETLRERGRKHKPDAAIEGVVVALMIDGGVETILGVKRDPVFGPIVIGQASLVEVLQDVTRRLAPFGVEEALEMIREIKGYPLLEGVRGGPVADVHTLAEALSRLSVLAHENRDRIDSIDINPFLVLSTR